MKPIITLLLIATCTSLSAQTTLLTGEYSKKTTTQKGEVFEWELSLQEDGTFLYHFYRNLNCAQCIEEHFYGKGTWKATSKVIKFSASESDIDTKHTINFNNSKARIHKKFSNKNSSKSPKKSIRFYASEVPTIKGLQLFMK